MTKVFDYFKEEINELKVALGSADFESTRAKKLTRQGVRLFKDGQVTSSCFVGAGTQGDLLAQAENNTAGALPYAVLPQAGTQVQKDVRSLCQVGEAEFFDLAVDFQTRLAKRIPNFVARGHLKRIDSELSYSNSLETDCRRSEIAIEYMTSLRRKGSPNSWDLFLTQKSFENIPSNDEIEALGSLMDVYDNVLPLKEGRMKVMMDPETLFLKLQESLSGDSYHRQSALYSGRLGEKIFSDKFTVVDVYEDPKRATLNPFDGEGMASGVNERVLIDRGTLKSLVYDLKTASKYSARSTGNGFRNFNTGVKVGFSGFTLRPGQRSYRQILQQSGDVIWVMMGFGGGFTDGGDFSTPVQSAFLIRDGKPIGRMPQFSVNSKLEKMFGPDLIEIAADGWAKGSLCPYTLMEMDVMPH